MRGFYLMHRGWQEHPVFGNYSFSRRDAWVWLIENACWKPRNFDNFGSKVELQRGQLCRSTRSLAKEWGWSEAKVRRFLKRLKSDAMIDTNTSSGRTVITVCNYGRYQSREFVKGAKDDARSDASTTQPRRTKEQGNTEKKPNNSSSEAWIWSEGCRYLIGHGETTRGASSLIGSWVREHEPETIKEAIEKAQLSAKGRPAPYIATILRNISQSQCDRPASSIAMSKLDQVAFAAAQKISSEEDTDE